MPDLFDNFTIKTRPSPKPPSLPPPADHLTTLSGIIKRMLPVDSEQILRYQEALTTMDAKFNIQDRLEACFQDEDFRPRVHAEPNLLEYFYIERLPFLEGGRFACSKPACYCCYHYISLHPGGFVRPSSHGIRYLNWRPPDLVNATDTREKNHQRDVLNRKPSQSAYQKSGNYPRYFCTSITTLELGFPRPTSTFDLGQFECEIKVTICMLDSLDIYKCGIVPINWL